MVVPKRFMPAMSEMPEPIVARDTIAVREHYEVAIPIDTQSRDMKWHAITIISMTSLVVVAVLSLIVL